MSLPPIRVPVERGQLRVDPDPKNVKYYGYLRVVRVVEMDFSKWIVENEKTCRRTAIQTSDLELWPLYDATKHGPIGGTP